MGCRRTHFGEWLQSVLELVAAILETVLARNPLVVVGGEAGKADGRVLELKEEELVDEDEGSEELEMEE